MNTVPTIYLNRVILRRLSDLDTDDLFEAFSNNEAMKYRHQRAMQSKQEANDLIKKSELLFEKQTGIRWGIEDIERGKLIGTFFWNCPNGKKESELGYSLHRGWWDKGIMKEIFEYMLHDFLWKHGAETLFAKVHKGNTVSIQVLEELGFELISKNISFWSYRKNKPN